MPKVTWLPSAARPGPKINYLAALLRGYKLASGLNSEELGKRLNCTADNVRRQIGKPADQWSIGQLKRYCDALGIPYEEALIAAAGSRAPARPSAAGLPGRGRKAPPPDAANTRGRQK